MGLDKSPFIGDPRRSEAENYGLDEIKPTEPEQHTPNQEDIQMLDEAPKSPDVPTESPEQ